MKTIPFPTLFCIAGLLAASPSLRADMPLPPPDKITETSRSGAIVAVSDPKTQTTKILKASSKGVLWEIPGWHRWLIVADDGRHLVTG